MSLLLLLSIAWLALLAMLLLCVHVVTGSYIRTDVRPVCPVGLHVEVVLVICSRGTRVLGSLGNGEALTYPLGRVPTAPFSCLLLNAFLLSSTVLTKVKSLLVGS